MTGEKNMFFPYPYKTFSKVCDITPELLKQIGIKGIILDIDGTLMRTKDKWPQDQVMVWIDDLKQNGIALYVLSNNKHPERVKAFAEHIGANWTYLAKKPFKKGFYRAAKDLQLDSNEIGVVGDQIFTDMLGAKLCGMKGLIVDSLDTYLWYYWPRHVFEMIFWKEKK